LLWRKYPRKGETRIAFFIRWLKTNEIPRLDALLLASPTKEQREVLRHNRWLTLNALYDAKFELESLEQQRIAKGIEDSIFQGRSALHDPHNLRAFHDPADLLDFEL